MCFLSNYGVNLQMCLNGLADFKKVSSFLDFFYIGIFPFPKQIMNKTCLNLLIVVYLLCNS